MASEEEKKLFGKVALVTGGSRGIGKAVAAAYARAGARVFICARNRARLERAAQEIRNAGGEVDFLAGDIGKSEEGKKIVRAARDHYGAIHILVNNASILGPRTSIVRYPVAAWKEVMRINLTALFVMTREVLRTMLPNRQGSIINVSSGVGRIGRAEWGAYSVSKFGVEGFTQVVAEEVREAGVRVNAVNPGGTRTDMRAEAYPGEDPLTLPTPEEITGVFLYLASDESSGVSGKSFDAREWLRDSN